jgi:hypothetical protein
VNKYDIQIGGMVERKIIDIKTVYAIYHGRAALMVMAKWAT